MVFNTTLIRYVCISIMDTIQNNKVRAMVFTTLSNCDYELRIMIPMTFHSKKKGLMTVI
jgi:hypothetical protein